MSSDKFCKSVAAAILSGGKNERMGGRNKAFIKIEGTPIIKRSLGVINEIFEEVFLVTNSPTDYSLYTGDALIITDVIKNAGPLGGIHAALAATSKEAVFFVGCDMPFLHNDFIRRQIAYFNESKSDAVVPRIADSIEPLHAVYKTDLKDNVYDFLRNGNDRSIRAFLRAVKVSYLDLEDNLFHRKIFKSINTQEELKQARRILCK